MLKNCEFSKEEKSEKVNNISELTDNSKTIFKIVLKVKGKELYQLKYNSEETIEDLCKIAKHSKECLQFDVLLNDEAFDLEEMKLNACKVI